MLCDDNYANYYRRLNINRNIETTSVNLEVRMTLFNAKNWIFSFSYINSYLNEKAMKSPTQLYT